MFYRETEKNAYFGLYVAENLLIRDPPANPEAIQDLKEKGLVLKIDDNLDYYLSCNIRFSDKKDRAWIDQPHLIAILQEEFGDEVSKLWNHVTLGFPSLSIVCNPLQEVSILQEDHKLYCSGVGMLLYLVTYSRLDIANPVRKLSKVLKRKCYMLSSMCWILKSTVYEFIQTRQRILRTGMFL